MFPSVKEKSMSIKTNQEERALYEYLPDDFKHAVDVSLVDLGAVCPGDDAAEEMIAVVTKLVLDVNPVVDRYVRAAKFMEDAKSELELALVAMKDMKAD